MVKTVTVSGNEIMCQFTGRPGWIPRDGKLPEYEQKMIDVERGTGVDQRTWQDLCDSFLRVQGKQATISIWADGYIERGGWQFIRFSDARFSVFEAQTGRTTSRNVPLLSQPLAMTGIVTYQLIPSVTNSPQRMLRAGR